MNLGLSIFDPQEFPFEESRLTERKTDTNHIITSKKSTKIIKQMHNLPHH